MLLGGVVDVVTSQALKQQPKCYEFDLGKKMSHIYQFMNIVLGKFGLLISSKNPIKMHNSSPEFFIDLCKRMSKHIQALI